MKQSSKGNLYEKIPKHIKKEIFEVIVKQPGLSIQRILTKGQTTDWLKQNTDEFVVLLEGSAKLLFEGNRQVSMKPGDYLNIPAGCRHRVSWTHPRQKTVWLATYYKNKKRRME